MSKIVIFDTETTSLEKPFVYNIGYVIYDTESKVVVAEHDFVVEQIWHNKELFTTAYYADKRDIYVRRMKARKTVMEKLGYITQFMYREFKQFEVTAAYAYNSPFDDKVFAYNCEWFKIINPFDNIPIYDIRGYVHKVVAFRPDFKAFCDRHEYYTESGNYSTTAETVYRFLNNDTEFIEEHTALADSRIEREILMYCVALGCEFGKSYKVYRSIKRDTEKTLAVRDTEGETHEYPYTSITIYKEKNNTTKIYLRKKQYKSGGGRPPLSFKKGIDTYETNTGA